ncbi:protein of unknown function [Paraburkholderia kururiensis]
MTSVPDIGPGATQVPEPTDESVAGAGFFCYPTRRIEILARFGGPLLYVLPASFASQTGGQAWSYV